MKKLFWEIFPKNKKGWDKYFDWCLLDSKIFYPVGKLLSLYAAAMLFITLVPIYVLLVLLFPLTRIELRIRSNKVRKQMEATND
ncbi:TPA: hypothetical protein U0826_001339 [Streptococcus suis]|uniref:hypothetical protein n=1 Tax=Streptococcus suis TaxID=1307 RepID=UPI002AA497A4|nr:hypothetical protein [Streptococcus suis]